MTTGKVIYIGPPAEVIKFQQRWEIDRRAGKPRNYEEFVRDHAAKIRAMVSNFAGLDPNDYDDITQTIIMQFIAGDYLNVYCSQKQSNYAVQRYEYQLNKYNSGQVGYLPSKYTGKFSTFLYQFVHVRLMGFRDKNNKVLFKSLDSGVEGSGVGETEVQPVAFSFGIPDDEFQNIELRNLCKRIYLDIKKRTVASETRNFPELFKRIVEAAFDQVSGFDREAYAKEKDITMSAVSMQIKELKTYLQQRGFWYDLHQLNNSRLRNSEV